MGDIVNLSRFRKARERKEAETKAASNRAAFGRPKDEKQATRLLLERSRREHELKHLEDKSHNDEPPKAG
ncbi:MAG TPA: DUF4169 family protein [Alphaproteobacteria bacterium]|jgi:hypothetical protein